MNNLYQNKNKLFPQRIKLPDKSGAGNFYTVNADFRNILRIFAMIKDGNIPEYKKIVKLIQWFYDFGEYEIGIGEIAIEETLASFLDFINADKRGNGAKNLPEPQFDFDFDAEEIYASFIGEYGIDLAEIDFMHWYKFKILLENLPPESAFKKKIELRFMDINSLADVGGLTGQLLEDITKAKEAVQLPEESEIYGFEEFEEFDNIWGKVGI